jgi:hypothetical protein
MNIRRLYYSNKLNMYPAYYVDTFLALTGFDEWDFSAIESWNDGYLNSDVELLQILNPDLISKMEARVKIAKKESRSVTVDSNL